MVDCKYHGTKINFFLFSVSGRELLERITKDDYALTEGDCIYYMQQICQGIDYMHSKRIMHLDLKLENILCLTEHSKDIKIIDFGLSRMYDPNNNLKVSFVYSSINFTFEQFLQQFCCGHLWVENLFLLLKQIFFRKAILTNFKNEVSSNCGLSKLWKDICTSLNSLTSFAISHFRSCLALLSSCLPRL